MIFNDINIDEFKYYFDKIFNFILFTLNMKNFFNIH